MSDRAGADGIAGLSTADAVAAVEDENPGLDPNVVEAALQLVTRDGVVRPEAAEAAMAETAKIVSTPETRLELAAIALEEAREAAVPVEDLAVVRSRLSRFESRLSAIEDRVGTLGEDLQELAGTDLEDASLFSVAREIQRIRGEANDLQYAADDLQDDVESFEEWLEEPAVRRAELSADVGAIGESLTQLEATLDALDGLDDGAVDESAADDGAAPDGEGEPTGEESIPDEPGAAWVEAAVGHRVTGLLVADVRAELAAVRAMAERLAEDPDDGTDVPSTADVEDRLDDIADRRAAIGDRVDALARPAWRQRYEDRLAAVDGVLAEYDPPVDWGDLQAALGDAQ